MTLNFKHEIVAFQVRDAAARSWAKPVPVDP